MTALTSLPELAMRSHLPEWNRELWERLPNDGKRYEVIDGVLYMTTAPSPFHQWIIRQIVRALFQQIDDQGVGTTLWSPIGLFMPGCDPVQPDVLVIRADELGMVSDGRISGVPALLIEVLSPSNSSVDLGTKRQAYARAGVPEYWIVRPAQRDVLVCTQPDAVLGDYAQTDHALPAGDLVSPTLPFRASVSGLFAGAPDTTL
ncbi:MAG: Uma2 family endonuclease [Roseiflexaceae bacterium]|nr:Uma2 family endonuclease [Roseiflexaceae bacterium]